MNAKDSVARDTGGPAFQVFVEREVLTDRGYRPRLQPEGGMTLRDYFAGQALANPVLMGDGWDVTNVVRAASMAYEIADALLRERAK